MPSDEQIQNIFDEAVIDHHMEAIGLDGDLVRKWLVPLIGAAVEAERQRWAGICDDTEDDNSLDSVVTAQEIKRRGLES